EIECLFVLGGVYQGDGTTCAQANCNVTGACCLPGQCAAGVPEFFCEHLGGKWLGQGSTCSECPGNAPTGACCLGAEPCQVATEIECLFVLGGVYQGDGTTCAQANCNVTGACCLPGQCAAGVPEFFCESLGGNWLGAGSSCANCPGGGPTGA